MKKAFLLVGLVAALVLVSGCVQPEQCAGEGELFDTASCCHGLVKVVNTCEKCKEEGQPLAFDGIPCCEGLVAVEGVCQKPSPEPTCVKEGETVPVIANPPECCEGLTLIRPKNWDIVGISGYCTAKCGDWTCDEEIESEYNCPEDCLGCGVFFETFVDANRVFSSKEEVLDFLANELNEEFLVGPAKEYPWDKDRVNQISIDAKNGKFNADNLRLIDYSQAEKEYWEATHCMINLTYESATPKVYYIKGEKWFVTEDGRLIVYESAGV